MRVFIATDSTPNAEFHSQIWRDNLVLPWMDLGHEVIEFNYDLRKTFLYVDHDIPDIAGFIEKNRPKVSEALLQQIKAAHSKKPIDLFFSYFYDACVTPEAIKEIRSMGIPTINWYCNGSYQMHLIEKLAPVYDWCLVPEKFRLEDYKKLGANPIYCQEAANPNIYRNKNLPKSKDVSFVGQGYGNRPDYVQFLLYHDIPIKVFGARWRTHTSPEIRMIDRLLYKKNKIPHDVLGPILGDQEMIDIFNSTKVNLGFSICGWTHLSQQPIRQVRLRDFEIPMCGGFYLMEYVEEIEDFFTVDSEVVCFRTADELRDKIRFYLQNDSEREKIRMAGNARALGEHTWQHRFQMVLQTIGLSKSTPKVLGIRQ